jgi:hypothetical protein
VIPFLASLADVARFGRLGLPFTAADQSDARAYLHALGFAEDTAVGGVEAWDEAERIAREPAWDRQWWTREEAERERLMRLATAKFGRPALLERLGAATELASEIIHAAAAGAAARVGVTDAALIRAAAGAATMGLHEAALVPLAGQGSDHVFVRKYALFAAGRWPLCAVRGVFYLF